MNQKEPKWNSGLLKSDFHFAYDGKTLRRVQMSFFFHNGDAMSLQRYLNIKDACSVQIIRKDDVGCGSEQWRCRSSAHI